MSQRCEQTRWVYNRCGFFAVSKEIPVQHTRKVKRIMHHRWKKNMAGMMAADHPTCRYVPTICMSYGLAALNAMRKALSIGGTNSFARSIPAQMDRTMILTNRTNWASWPCARFTKDDIDYFRTKVDETWEKWLVLGVLPLRKLWNLCGVGCRQRGNQRSTKTLKSDGHPRRCIYG
jgi:hypothetical protein